MADLEKQVIDELSKTPIGENGCFQRGFVTEIARRLDISRQEANIIVMGLVKRGVIVAQGAPKSGKYSPAAELMSRSKAGYSLEDVVNKLQLLPTEKEGWFITKKGGLYGYLGQFFPRNYYKQAFEILKDKNVIESDGNVSTFKRRFRFVKPEATLAFEKVKPAAGQTSSVTPASKRAKKAEYTDEEWIELLEMAGEDLKAQLNEIEQRYDAMIRRLVADKTKEKEPLKRRLGEIQKAISALRQVEEIRSKLPYILATE